MSVDPVPFIIHLVFLPLLPYNPITYGLTVVSLTLIHGGF